MAMMIDILDKSIKDMKDHASAWKKEEIIKLLRKH